MGYRPPQLGDCPLSPKIFEILKKSPSVSYQNLSITHYRISPYQYTDGLSPCIRRQLFGYIRTSGNVRLYTLRVPTLYEHGGVITGKGTSSRLSEREKERILWYMSESKPVLLYTQDGLEEVRQRVNTTMVNMIDRTVQSMDRMSKRLDEVELAMDKMFDPSKMTRNELMAYTAFLRDSFRMRQDFLRTLSGYDVNISKVPVQADSAPIYDEEKADALRDEVLRRDKKKETEG